MTHTHKVTQPVTVMLGFEQEQPSYSCSLFLDPLTHSFSPALPVGIYRWSLKHRTLCWELGTQGFQGCEACSHALFSVDWIQDSLWLVSSGKDTQTQHLRHSFRGYTKARASAHLRPVPGAYLWISKPPELRILDLAAQWQVNTISQSFPKDNC